MTFTNGTLLPDDAWQRNLSALRHMDPDLANCLAALPLPPMAVPAVGRDGSSTFKLRTPHGEHWLGFTSMPTISGPALLANFDPGGGNVALPGIGQGTEARLLTERLGRNRAVFVLESDLGLLRLALHVHDLAAAIEQGRLVFIVGPNLEESLVGFFERHDGYLVPERMLSWPWMEPPALNEMTLVLQRAVTRINRRRSSMLGEISLQLEGLYATPPVLAEKPRTLVVCPHPHGDAHRLAGELQSGLNDADWPCEVWLGDSPGMVHPLSLAGRIVRFHPELAILVDSIRGAFGPVIPAALPIATWMTRGARFTRKAVEGIGPKDRVFCMSSGTIRDLEEAGAASAQLSRLPPAVLAVGPASEQDSHVREYGVIAVANAPSLDPEANGLSLESHRAVWRLVEQRIREGAEHYTDGDVERILHQVENDTGARFGDPIVRRELCDQINTVLAQTIVRTAVFESLLRAGIDLTVWGWGWKAHPRIGTACRGPAPNSDFAGLCARARMVLYVDVTGNVATDLLVAAASGAVVLARAHPTDQGPTGLASLLAPGRDLLIFRRHSEAVHHVKRLLGDESARRAMAERTRSLIAEHHTMRHRLEFLRRAMVKML